MKLRLEFISLLAVVIVVTAAAIPFNLYRYEIAGESGGLIAYSMRPSDAGLNPIIDHTPNDNSDLAAISSIAGAASFNGALEWVKGAGYFLMFIAMVIEGPIITSAAAFAAALGYFNIFAIFFLSIAGDLVGDYIYYAIGYFGRVQFVEKYGHRIGLTEKRLKHMERLIKKHPKKTLAAIKLAPLLPAPGLMMIGATRMPVRRYTAMTFLVALPKTLFFMVLGYYFGSAYDRFSSIFQNGEYFMLIAVALTVVAFYGYQKISASFSTQLEAI